MCCFAPPGKAFLLAQKVKAKNGWGEIFGATNRFLLRGHHRLIVHVTPGHTLIRKVPGLLTLSHLNKEKKARRVFCYVPCLIEREREGGGLGGWIFWPVGKVFTHKLAGIFFSPSQRIRRRFGVAKEHAHTLQKKILSTKLKMQNNSLKQKKNTRVPWVQSHRFQRAKL